MKKIVSVLAILFCITFFANKSQAQGNLQFNQVRFYDIAYGTPQAFTVPAGKVWKVESIGVASNTCSVYLLNSGSQYIGTLFTGGTSSLPSLPLWFPSSYSGFFSYNVGSCSGQRAYVSIIEFNVIP